MNKGQYCKRCETGYCQVADARQQLKQAVDEHVSADVLQKLVGELSDARYVCLGTEASQKNFYKRRAAQLDEAMVKMVALVKTAWEGGSATAHNATVEGYYLGDDTFDESELPAEVAKILEALNGK